MKTPELLAPAGSLLMAQTALEFGATAVYAGQPRYSLRVRNNDFGQIENLQKGIEHAHERNAKFYVVSNIYPHNSKIKTYLADMAPVIALKPDALIMADPGLMLMIREQWPEMPIHLSVQANTVNYAAVRFWQSVGVKRIILSRELSLDEVAEIRQMCPDVELEVFAHGALCIAYSGRCLLSGYFSHRDPNQGACTNSCRWGFDVKPATESFTGDSFLLEEKTRPGELMPIEEDEHGTYILNSKDLRAVEFVEKLVNMGIDSLKIEGRTKSAYYVARTSQSYRQAIDDAVNGRPFDNSLIADLSELANRGYTAGFYKRGPDDEAQNYADGSSMHGHGQYAGDILEYQNNLALVRGKNKFRVGDTIRIVHPSGNEQIVIDKMTDKNGNSIDTVLGEGHFALINLPPNKQGAFIVRLD